MSLDFRFHSGLLTSCGLFVLLVAAGCTPEDQIAHYSVPKPESIRTPINRPAGMPEMPPGMGAGMGRPPMADSGGAAISAGDLKFEKPENWEASAGNAFSMKAFEVVDGAQRIEITVSLTGGDLTDNMNRWRGQVGLQPVSADEMAKAYEPIEVNGLEGKFVTLHSPETEAEKQSILGAAIPVEGRTLFVKLRGSTDLANREREHLQAFTKSLKW